MPFLSGFNQRGNVISKLVLCLALFIWMFAPHASTAETFPTAIPKTKGELAVMIKAVLQKDAAFLKSFKVTASTASATMKIKNEDVTLVAFKRPGVSKVLLAIVPKSFKLTSFVPIPSGTPADGVSFSKIALVYVPKGAGKSGVSTSGLPAPLSHSFSGLGGKTDFKDGLNIFGEADFRSAGVVKKLLSTVGHSDMQLPLSGVFSADILRYDIKTASQKLKEEMFNGLNLKLPLPKLSIPGMPKMVTITDSHLAIVGSEVKGKRKIFAGVTGEMNVKLGNSTSKFNFGMFTGDKVELTAQSKGKTTLQWAHKFELSNLKFKATRKSGKWNVSIRRQIDCQVEAGRRHVYPVPRQ